MTEAGMCFLTRDRSERGLSLAAYAVALGMSKTALVKLPGGNATRPAAKIVAALCREFGRETVAAWFPDIARVDLVARVVERCGTPARLAKTARVSRRTVDATLYAGEALTAEQAERLAEALGLPTDALPIRPEPQTRSVAELATREQPQPGNARTTTRRYSTRDVVRLLIRFHLVVREGRIVPPWPSVQDNAPFEQVLTEWRRCGMESPNRKGGR